ncbi:MAG TPA: hypothetical protein VFV38_10230 [Ktedonobacteraceae bacterium]|nr:hypothetical protein [Ktedonobacteraceae bacterium]
MSHQQPEHIISVDQSQLPAHGLGAVEIQPYQSPSVETQEVAERFRDLERKQMDFLNEAGKSLIERISTFLAILLGASVLSNNFPPTYLKGNLLARIIILVVLGCYLLAMGIAMWSIQPRWYRRYLYNMSALARVRDRIITQKMRWLRLAGILFLVGSLALAVLIIEIIWNITQ